MLTISAEFYRTEPTKPVSGAVKTGHLQQTLGETSCLVLGLAFLLGHVQSCVRRYVQVYVDFELGFCPARPYDDAATSF
jgi:hypothetical protein